MLDQLGLKHCVDKSSAGNDVLKTYEPYLQGWIDKKVSVLEYFHDEAESLQLWQEYFPRGEILGITYRPEKAATPMPGTEVSYWNEADADALQAMLADRRLDIVIDDGSHHWRSQMWKMKCTMPQLAAGGLYIIQAIHTSSPEHAHAYGHGETTSPLTFLIEVARNLAAGTSSPDPFASYLMGIVKTILFFPTCCILQLRPRANAAALRVCSIFAAGTVLRLSNGGVYERARPVIISAPEGVSQLGASEYALKAVTAPEAFLAEVEPALFTGRGAVVSPAAGIIVESLINTNYVEGIPGFVQVSSERYVFEHADAERLPDGNYVLLKQNWDDNYGHWIIECLPRVGLVAEAYGLSDFRFIVTAYKGAMAEVYRDSLGLAGVGTDQVRFLPDKLYSAAKLYYPAPLTRQPWRKAPRVIAFLEGLRDTVLARSTSVAKGPERLYVSRNALSKRRLVNEEEIIALVEKFGYRVVRPETMSFAEQVQVFSNAQRVIGNLGAALTNVVFAPRQLSLFALTTEFMVDDFFWDLVSQKQGRYISLHGIATQKHLGMQSDFLINPDKVREAIVTYLES